ncbi:E3 ubiquitin-protein ligase TRIM22-like [Amphiura filiformis]|uniref:E3 ubiquitin-protein ligase TRIM22-like n=1 Tax=Amphiura filiformis TaxID=82378 RepID=UPI003B20D97E
MFPVITTARPRRTMAEQFEEDLTCPLCFELFVDPHIPKDLDCPHVVCQMCLKDMVKGMKRIITCPECRRKTRVPQGGIRSLKTNLRLRSLAKKHHDHQTVKQKTGAKVCPRHGEELRLICMTCKSLICPFCLIDEHRQAGHNVKGLGEVRQEQKSEMVHILQDAEAEREQCNKRASELLEVEKQIENALKLEEDKIDKRVDILIQEARQKGQEMKVELRKRDQKRLDRIRGERLHMSERAVSIKTACINSLNISDTVPDAVYVRQHDILIKETQNLMTFDELSNVDTSITVTAFVPDTSTSSMKLGKLEKVAKTKESSA